MANKYQSPALESFEEQVVTTHMLRQAASTVATIGMESTQQVAQDVLAAAVQCEAQLLTPRRPVSADWK